MTHVKILRYCLIRLHDLLTVFEVSCSEQSSRDSMQSNYYVRQQYAHKTKPSGQRSDRHVENKELEKVYTEEIASKGKTCKCINTYLHLLNSYHNEIHIDKTMHNAYPDKRR